MGFWDFIFGWKVINDQTNENLTEEDELMDMMYIIEDIEKNEKKKEKNHKDKNRW